MGRYAVTPLAAVSPREDSLVVVVSLASLWLGLYGDSTSKPTHRKLCEIHWNQKKPYGDGS